VPRIWKGDVDFVLEISEAVERLAGNVSIDRVCLAPRDHRGNMFLSVSSLRRSVSWSRGSFVMKRRVKIGDCRSPEASSREWCKGHREDWSTGEAYDGISSLRSRVLLAKLHCKVCHKIVPLQIDTSSNSSQI